MAAPFLSRLRKPAVDQPPAQPQPDAPRRRPLPPVGELRRERRALLRVREERIRDLGGIVLEMYRRDQFREDLVYEQAADLVALDERLAELDALLAAAAGAPRGFRGLTRCKCGAPLPRGAHFCAHCGRPAQGTPPVAACSHCGQPLPAETNFCPSCGNASAAEDFRPGADRERGREDDLGAVDSTIARRPREEREAP